MLTSPDQALPHRPHTQTQDASPFTKVQQTQPSPLDHSTHPLYGRTRLYGFMAFNNEISQKFLLFLQHRCPTHIFGMPPLSLRYNEPNPVRWTTGHTHYIDGQDYGFIMGLVNEIAQKFPLFSPLHLHHFTSTTSPPLHTVSGCLPLHRGTTNLTQSVRPQYTHPIWMTRLCGFMA